MISHGVVPRQFLARNVLARFFRLNYVFRRCVLRHEKEDHDYRDDEEHCDVEPPRSVQVLNVFRLQKIVPDAQKSELVHQVLHNCA